MVTIVDMKVRDATPSDASACAAIYAPYVTDTIISFEITPPSVAEMAARIARIQATHAWLVLEDSGEVVGYAYGGPFRERAAYRFACEVSVYLSPARRRSGGGRMLYTALFERLAERGFRTVCAGMTLPNDASVALHRALGFQPVGTFRGVGWKNNAWHDVAWAQRTISEAAPAEPS
jgi:L-amino acid N-acyltransferase YncA